MQGGGHFSGVNRKVQLKPLRWRPAPLDPHTSLFAIPQPPAGASPLRTSSSVSTQDVASAAAAAATAGPAPAAGQLSAASSGAGTGPLPTPTGSSGGAKPLGGSTLQLEEALLVVKWGGVLTHAGRQQAEQLGKRLLLRFASPAHTCT